MFVYNLATIEGFRLVVRSSGYVQTSQKYMAGLNCNYGAYHLLIWAHLVDVIFASWSRPGRLMHFVIYFCIFPSRLFVSSIILVSSVWFGSRRVMASVMASQGPLFNHWHNNERPNRRAFVECMAFYTGKFGPANNGSSGKESFKARSVDQEVRAHLKLSILWIWVELRIRSYGQVTSVIKNLIMLLFFFSSRNSSLDICSWSWVLESVESLAETLDQAFVNQSAETNS